MQQINTKKQQHKNKASCMHIICMANCTVVALSIVVVLVSVLAIVVVVVVVGRHLLAAK